MSFPFAPTTFRLLSLLTRTQHVKTPQHFRNCLEILKETLPSQFLQNSLLHKKHRMLLLLMVCHKGSTSAVLLAVMNLCMILTLMIDTNRNQSIAHRTNKGTQTLTRTSHHFAHPPGRLRTVVPHLYYTFWKLIPSPIQNTSVMQMTSARTHPMTNAKCHRYKKIYCLLCYSGIFTA